MPRKAPPPSTVLDVMAHAPKGVEVSYCEIELLLMKWTPEQVVRSFAVPPVYDDASAQHPIGAPIIDSRSYHHPRYDRKDLMMLYWDDVQ